MADMDSVLHCFKGDDGEHFEAIVVSPEFEGLSMVKQHQLVYQALGARLGVKYTSRQRLGEHIGVDRYEPGALRYRRDTGTAKQPES